MGLMSQNLEEACNKHIVKSFLDLIVLSMLANNPMHGYKIIAVLHNNFGVLLSPGTLYPLLYKLEGENMVKIAEVKRRKIYSLTPQGRRRASHIFKTYKKSIEKILNIINFNLVPTAIAARAKVKLD